MRQGKTVNLVRRVKTPQGWRRYEVATHPNGRVKHHFVLVPAPGATKNTPGLKFYKKRPYREEEHKEGAYELQRYEGGQPVYEPLGDDPVEAKRMLDAAILVNNAITANEEAGLEPPVRPGKVKLETHLWNYMDEKKRRGKLDMAESIRLAGQKWLEMLPKGITPEEIKPQHLKDYLVAMREEGYHKTTIKERYARLVGLLTFADYKFTKAVREVKPDKPEKKLPEYYTKAQRDAFLAACETDRESLIFNVLLKLGLRDQEATYLEPWEFDWEANTVTIHSKDDQGFLIKDKAERRLPVRDDLGAMIKAYQQAHPGLKWLLQNEDGQPDHYMLKLAKRIGKRAGLMCRVFLHKFRATYCTQLLRDGVDIRTVQVLMGHDDLATTMKYLAAIEAEDKKLQRKLNRANF